MERKIFKRSLLNGESPIEINDSDPPDASEAVSEQEFPGGADLKLETDPEGYSDNSDNTPSSLYGNGGGSSDAPENRITTEDGNLMVMKKLFNHLYVILKFNLYLFYTFRLLLYHRLNEIFF